MEGENKNWDYIATRDIKRRLRGVNNLLSQANVLADNYSYLKPSVEILRLADIELDNALMSLRSLMVRIETKEISLENTT